MKRHSFVNFIVASLDSIATSILFVLLAGRLSYGEIPALKHLVVNRVRRWCIDGVPLLLGALFRIIERSPLTREATATEHGPLRHH